MPLDYSKWDNLEISDDSDIEVHPNVDKRSMIKWKQEALHRERAERRAKMDYLNQFVPQQKNVLKKVQEFIDMLKNSSDASEAIQRVLKALDQHQTEASQLPAPKDPNMMDMSQVFGAMKDQIKTGLETTSPEQVKSSLLERFEQTQATVQKTVDQASAELDKLTKEASKKLTSENMFTSEKSNKTVINKSKPTPTPKKKTTTKVVETLNPNATMKDLSLQDQASDDADDEDEDIEMSPKATQFSKLRGFEDSYKFLLKHADIINEKTSDSILGQAFTAQLKGEEEYAKNCVIQSLMLQYCGQLGKDGVNLFFSRMSAPNTQGRKMFFDDVDKTYGRIQTRCAEIAAEEVTEQNGVETIQLQPMGDGSQLTIRIPTPEDQEPYKIFNDMPTTFQEALKTGKLEEINKVLEKLPVPEAEQLVHICSEYGFLDVEGEVIDETQQQQQQ
ncbi:Hsp90 co-chaperone Cdc37 [Choanephora cucurbitarum]|uniref:Hsp90 chaperone protein kinase-targeting subunit n=1 Tax=Choanephora cucurbitarum TaxID=101091 RepID=A0A1C7N5G9_9FUNG|nr:Hsp90 co-chaperone Cdc37 [Choanephora cucurbitarum]